MNQVQQSAFELDLDRLRRLAAQGQELSGCLLAACSAHSAQPRTQSEVIKFLMDSGVGVNETDKNGVTPLHRAVRFRSLKAVEVLLAGGADINAIDRRSKSTALHRAVTHSGAPATAGKSDIAVAIARWIVWFPQNRSSIHRPNRPTANLRLHLGRLLFGILYPRVIHRVQRLH